MGNPQLDAPATGRSFLARDGRIAKIDIDYSNNAVAINAAFQ